MRAAEGRKDRDMVWWVIASVLVLVPSPVSLSSQSVFFSFLLSSLTSRSSSSTAFDLFLSLVIPLPSQSAVVISDIP